MSREILFRAWVKEENKMYQPVNPFHVDDLDRLCWNHDQVLMQFTGLYDINKIPIYEGDILYCHEYDSSDCMHQITQTFKNAVVGFSQGNYYYYPKGNMKCAHQLLMYAYKPKVIGNIYENPELLTDEK